jgi:hypothetical protein
VSQYLKPSQPAGTYSQPLGSVRRKRAIFLGIGIPALILILAFAVFLLPSMFVARSNTSIGAEGGSIKLGDMSLTFDAGIVDEPLSVKLAGYKPGGEAKPDGLLSSLTTVELDGECDKPVAIRIKVPDGKDESKIVIGVGTALENGDLKTSIVHYRYVETRVTDGYAEAEVIPSFYAFEAELPAGKAIPGTALAASKSFKVVFGAFETEAELSSGGHFKLHYSIMIPTLEVWSTLNDLEYCYDYFVSEGYDFPLRTEWPIDVYVCKMGKDLGAYVESGKKNAFLGKSPNHGWIEINKNVYASGYKSATVKPVLGHEFFHFVQSNFLSADGAARNEWFDDATATYYERMLQGSTPTVFSQYKFQIFDGVIPKEDTSQAGYARYPVVGYLVENVGKGVVKTVYQDLAKGTAVSAAITTAAGKPETWSENCYEYVINDEIADFSALAAHRDLIDRTGDFNTVGSVTDFNEPTEEDIDKAAEEGTPVLLDKGEIEVPALGVRFLAVDVDKGLAGLLTDSMSLQFTVSGGGLRLFTCYAKAADVSAATDGKLTVTTFKKDLDGGRKYLLMVTNPSTAAATVELTAELTMCPTLEELVGTCADGSFLISDVYVSDAIKSEARDTDLSHDDYGDSNGCEARIQEAYSYKGQRFPLELGIEQTGPGTGRLLIIEGNGDSTALPFTYKDGILSVSFEYPISEFMKGATGVISGQLKAAYGKKSDVTVSGSLTCVMKGREKDAYMTYEVNGSHALPPKP